MVFPEGLDGPRRLSQTPKDYPKADPRTCQLFDFLSRFQKLFLNVLLMLIDQIKVAESR